jgi:hypothetical protein
VHLTPTLFVERRYTGDRVPLAAATSARVPDLEL